MTTALAIISAFVLAAIYIRCIAYVIGGSRQRFRTIELLVFSTAVALLAAAGFAWDSLTVVLLTLYAAFCGPLCRQVVARWTTGSLATAVWTSAAILGSFFVLLALASMFVYTYDAMTLKAWKSGYWSMFPTGYIAIEYIWHEEADNAWEFFVCTLPFSLPVNLAAGLLIGAALGPVAFAWSRSTLHRSNNP